jgi:serine/threonine protein kinase
MLIGLGDRELRNEVTLPTQAGAGRPGAQAAGRQALQQAVGERYLLQQEVGRGGFGAVYRAVNRQTGQTCCLKFLHREMARGFALIRFKREFRTARRLRHPGCVQVHELGHEAGQWFFAMELVDGVSLRQARAALAGDFPTVAAIALQLLAALDHVHNHAVVHRDIKPQNVLVELAGAGQRPVVAKLADFGVAKVGDLDDDERILALRGSAPYLAPEIFTDCVADPRADLYALGVTLYEVLAGRHPMAVERRLSVEEWIRRIATHTPAPLTDVAPQVPGRLAAVVMGLMARDPAQRYRTAALAHDDLKRCQRTLVDGPAGSAAVHLTGSPYLAAPRLIGRDRERETMEGFLAANLAGSGDRPAATSTGPESGKSPAPLLLLSGPAGVGKSRLLSWLARRAGQGGARLYVGQCRCEIAAPLEGIAPILHRMHQPPAESPLAPDSDETLSIDGLRESSPLSSGQPSRLTPSRLTGIERNVGSDSFAPGSGPIPDARPDPNAQRQLLYELTAQLLAAVDGPTLLVIEDIQWADSATLELIGLLVRSIALDREDGRWRPVAIVCTCRPTTATSELSQLSRALMDDGRALAVPVNPLSSEDTTTLVAELLMQPVDDRLTSACRHLFAGKEAAPLYITQVLRLLVARGLLTAPGVRWDGTWDFSRLDSATHVVVPPTVEDAIGQQAARLSADTKFLLSIAAVVGRRFGIDLVTQAGDLDGDLVVDCIEEAARAGFVSEDLDDDEAFVFNHDRVREALLDALPADQRRHLHRVVGDALVARSTRGGHDVAADLALHYDRAGDSALAYRYSLLAANEARRARQFARASDLFAMAVTNADALGRAIPDRIMERVADVASLAVHTERGKAAYERVLARPRDRMHRLRLYRKLAALHNRANDGDRALVYYEKVWRTGMPWYLANPGVFWPISLSCLLTAFWFLSPDRCRAMLAWPLRNASRRHRQELARCQAETVITAVHGARVSAILRAFSLGGCVGASLHDTADRGTYAITCAGAAFFEAMSLSRRKRLERWLALADTATQESWPDRDRLWFLATIAAVHWISGRCDVALACNQQAVDIATVLRDPLLLKTTGHFLGEHSLFFRRFDRVPRLLRTLRRYAEVEGVPQLETTAMTIEVNVRTQLEDYSGALEKVQILWAKAAHLDRVEVLMAQLCELVCRAQLGEDPGTLAPDVLDYLREAERFDSFAVPFASFPALALGLAASLGTDVEAAHPGWERALRKSRRRWRPLGTRSHWRGSQWIAARALYDANRGHADRAARQFVDHLEGHGFPYSRFLACVFGLRVFPPGSEAHRRCQAQLDKERAATSPLPDC